MDAQLNLSCLTDHREISIHQCISSILVSSLIILDTIHDSLATILINLNNSPFFRYINEMLANIDLIFNTIQLHIKFLFAQQFLDNAATPLDQALRLRAQASL